MRIHLFTPKSLTTSPVKRAPFLESSQSQGALKHDMDNHEFVSKLLDRKWLLSSPDAKVNQIMISNSKAGRLSQDIAFHNTSQPCLGEGMISMNQSCPSFYVVRDDLLHPLVNGNKARKLDALLPLLEDNAVTDVVTCGGSQSAHAAAVAVSCSERGIKSHLLLRGEEPEILTGYNLVSRMYGDVVYVPRSVYAKREEILARHAESIVGNTGSIVRLNDIVEASHHASGEQWFWQVDPVKYPEKPRKVVIIKEGAGDVVALLGVMRLIQYLSQSPIFGEKQALKIIVDAGTGTTATGLGLGILCLGLPWEVTAVMLADKINGYREKEQNLMSDFLRICPSAGITLSKRHPGNVQWVERCLPRKFGNILKGEVEECQKIAQQTGILVDPMYTLAAWDLATQLSQNAENNSKVVMLHTGGTLGMFGLAQRYRSYF